MIGKEGFFISPDGKLIPVESTHINAIIDHPESFGFTKRHIEGIFNKHSEPLGKEGFAREEIILQLIQAGWSRIRKYPQYWSVQIPEASDAVMGYLSDFARKAVSGDEPFKLKAWANEIVKLSSLKDGIFRECRMYDLAEFAGNEANMNIRPTR